MFPGGGGKRLSRSSVGGVTSSIFSMLLYSEVLILTLKSPPIIIGSLFGILSSLIKLLI